MSLNWSGQPGNLVAVGAKGIYTIQTVAYSGAKYVLQGVGHDDLVMVQLPFMGREFGDLKEAMKHADWIENQAAVESQGSGT
jgi:hypothetical protein